MVSVHDEGVLRDRQWKLERRTEVLFGLAIGKSNMDFLNPLSGVESFEYAKNIWNRVDGRESG